ncbi:GNAT family N-acetyltransferase [Membranihabitans maritimus]|uniref:GNAT family N-acetyltransferase n=1 Tax=Membranihabitans maritimus TaxID=2904244 RepID=UPI001F24C8CA|nr:GNAT family N-acetyltransferase [Membranihabitans maritimus]
MKIKHDQTGSKGAFTAVSNGSEAGKLTYSKAGSTKIILDHTEVGPAFKGQGVGRQLVMKAIEYARGNQLKIIPLCPYAKSVFEKTPEIRDVL